MQTEYAPLCRKELNNTKNISMETTNLDPHFFFNRENIKFNFVKIISGDITSQQRRIVSRCVDIRRTLLFSSWTLASGRPLQLPTSAVSRHDAASHVASRSVKHRFNIVNVDDFKWNVNQCTTVVWQRWFNFLHKDFGNGISNCSWNEVSWEQKHCP